MVNYCMVPRCTNKTRKGRAVSFHLLPRDSEKCKQWLRIINHPKIGEDIEAVKQQKVCSLHFKPEDFEFNALGMKRAALLHTAIPSIFTFPDQDEQPGTSGTSGGKRLKTKRTSAAALLPSSEDDVELQSAPMLSTKGINPPSVQAQFSPCPITPGLNTIASIPEVGETVKSPKLSTSEDEGVCEMCGQPTSSKTIFDSGRRTVKWMCLGGHSGTWASSADVSEEPETAPCVESCPELTFDLSEFNFDEENDGSNEEGEEAEVENNSPSEEDEEEEENEEEKDDRDSDWQSHDSDRLLSDDSGESGSGEGGSGEGGSDSESELPKNKKTRQLCPECGAFFYTSKAHTCEYKIKPFSCNDCGKRCVDANSLKLHSAIHKESYKHLCKFCLAPFKTKLDKHAHEGAHAPCYKPYRCPDCSETFTKILARNKHLKGHRGPKRYTCPHCPMEFRNENHMERHIVVHTGMRPHVCEFCSRSFTQPGHLKSHLRVHTGEKPFQCQHCDKSFNHNVSLKSHVVRYHKEGASDFGPSGPAPRSKRTLRETLGRPKGRPKRNAATSAIPVVRGDALDPTTAAKASGKGRFRRDSSEDIDSDSDWSDRDPSPELTDEDKSKEVRKSKRKASQRPKTDYIVEKDSESDADGNPEEEAKKRKCVKSQET